MLHQLDRVLRSQELRPTQWRLFFLCGLGWAADMAWVIGISIVMNEIGKDWSISVAFRSVLPISLMLGVTIGSVFWGYFSDRSGRILPFKVTLFIAGFAGIVAALSTNIWMLAAACFAAGIGLGGNLAVDGTVFLEYCPASYKWTLTAMSGVCVLGSFAVSTLAWVFTMAGISMLWRFLLGSVAVSSLVTGVFRLNQRETPYFLIHAGRIAEAHELISELTNGNSELELEIELLPVQTPVTPVPPEAVPKVKTNMFFFIMV